MKYSRAVLLFSSLWLVLFMGCSKKIEDIFKEPDLKDIRKVLKMAMPISYAANVAMASMEGARLPNVIMLQTGDTSSVGSFIMQVTVDSTFPMPDGVSGQGKITVAGFNAKANMAMMTVMFTDMDILQGKFTIQNVATFPVVKHQDIISGKEELIVVYADIDINAGSDTLFTVGVTQDQIDAEFTRYQTMQSFDSSVVLEENAWIIRIDDQGTTQDALDDRYVISGGGQYIEAGSSGGGILQVTMINVAMTPQCCKNAVEGWALLQNMGAETGGTGPDVEVGHVLLTFRDTCDGKVEVTAATGVYTRSWGKNIPLNLEQ